MVKFIVITIESYLLTCCRHSCLNQTYYNLTDLLIERCYFSMESGAEQGHWVPHPPTEIPRSQSDSTEWIQLPSGETAVTHRVGSTPALSEPGQEVREPPLGDHELGGFFPVLNHNWLSLYHVSDLNGMRTESHQSCKATHKRYLLKTVFGSLNSGLFPINCMMLLQTGEKYLQKPVEESNRFRLPIKSCTFNRPRNHMFPCGFNLPCVVPSSLLAMNYKVQETVSIAHCLGAVFHKKICHFKHSCSKLPGNVQWSCSLGWSITTLLVPCSLHCLHNGIKQRSLPKRCFNGLWWLREFFPSPKTHADAQLPVSEGIRRKH